MDTESRESIPYVGAVIIFCLYGEQRVKREGNTDYGGWREMGWSLYHHKELGFKIWPRNVIAFFIFKSGKDVKHEHSPTF